VRNPLSAKKTKSITHYLMKGPEAVERRLAKLEVELKVWEARILHLTSVSFHFAEKFGPTKMVPRATAKMRDLATRTLHELRSERDALKTFVGEHLRPWETKKSDPAPI
jgi:hypothetical protein